MKEAPRPAAQPTTAIPEELYPRIALLGIGVVTFLRLLWLAGGPIDLYPDEAQYWIWSQHLAWGYVSKPPMIAWIIRASTTLLGESDLAIKAGAPILYVVTGIFVFFLSRLLYGGRIAAWTAIAFITLPSVFLSSLIISTDVPLLLFWTLATYGFVRARESGNARWWLLVGVAGGLGLLAKYAMGFWLLSALLLLSATPDERKHLRHFLLAATLALLIYAPNFVWNWQHGFASYHHTEANASIHGLVFHPEAFAEFGLSQIGVFGPVFIVVLGLIVWRWRESRTDRRIVMLLAFTLPTLLIMLIEAGLSRAQPNWSAPAYVTATILVVGYLGERKRDGWIQWSVVLHALLAVLVLGAGDVARAIGKPLPGKLDPLHRVHGWRIMGGSLARLRVSNGLPQLLFDDRELMASMIYYIQPHPFDARIWHPKPTILNQFELDNPLPATLGGDYMYVTRLPDPRDILDSFDHHEQLAHITVPLGSGLTREIWVYGLHGFKGYTPPQGTP